MKKNILGLLIIVGLTSCQKWSDTKEELLKQGYIYEIDVPTKGYYIYSKGLEYITEVNCIKLLQSTTVESNIIAPHRVCRPYTITDLRESE